MGNVQERFGVLCGSVARPAGVAVPADHNKPPGLQHEHEEEKQQEKHFEDVNFRSEYDPNALGTGPRIERVTSIINIDAALESLHITAILLDKQQLLSNTNALSPPFHKEVIKYHLVIPNSVFELSITPIAVDKGSFITMEGHGQVNAFPAEERDPWLINQIYDVRPPVEEEDSISAVVGQSPALQPARPKPAGNFMPRGLQSFQLSNLPVGDSDFRVIVQSSLLNLRTYELTVHRQPYSQTGFHSIGTSNREKFLWYLHGAVEGYAEAQYSLALMFNGEDGEAEKPKDDGDQSLQEIEWVKFDPAEAKLYYYKWLLMAAEQHYLPAHFKLGHMYLNGEVYPEWFPQDTSTANSVKMTDELLLKEAAWWFFCGAQDGQGEVQAQCAYELFLMFLTGTGVKPSFRIALNWLDKSNRAEEFFEAELERARAGDQSAMTHVATMYLNGTGVDMSFDAFTHWHIEAGGHKGSAREKIRSKFMMLKPKYKRLFEAYDQDRDGEINREDFEGFYRDCLMTRGISKDEADRVTIEPYQGSRKSFVLFRSYDERNKGVLSFDSFWDHPHTKTSVIPQNEKQLKACKQFFDIWATRIPTHSRKSSLGLNKIISTRALSSVMLGPVEAYETDRGTMKYRFTLSQFDDDDDEDYNY